MKYFVLEAATVNGATATNVTIKESEDEARALFHQILASAYANPNVTYALAEVIQENGFALMMEKLPREEEEAVE